MVSEEVTVLNLLGLHARPIAKLVTTLSGSGDSVSLWKGDHSADAKDIYQIMMLDAKCGDQLKVCVDGPDESKTLETVVELFRAKFNET